jgi:methylphosphotriester-DNA--protein-cysteine methyltransferase
MSFKLMGADGWIRASSKPGKLGGHRKLKIYGRLDCPSALRFIARGQYTQHRVFFKDEATAIAAGFRPCAKCMTEEYKKWKDHQAFLQSIKYQAPSQYHRK